jgi:hypothetical protein
MIRQCRAARQAIFCRQIAAFSAAGPRTARVHRGAPFPKFRFIVAHYVAAPPNMISIGTSIFNVWDMNGF